MPYLPEIIDMHVLMIDTDKYSGNFDHELCSFMTGRVGVNEYYTHKTKYHKLFDLDVDTGRIPSHIIKEIKDNSIDILSDAYGDTLSTVSSEMYRTPPTTDHNTVGIFFFEQPSDEFIQYIKDRFESFGPSFKNRMGCDAPVNLIDVRVVKAQAVQGY